MLRGMIWCNAGLSTPEKGCPSEEGLFYLTSHLHRQYNVVQ